MTLDADHTSPESYLKRFGLSEFRPGQRDVVTAVLSGKDVLCIMPTGGGKSLCFQLPSLARDGLTLVVSPLIALMKDQVDVLQQKGIRAEYINSSLSPQEQNRRLERFQAGEYDLLYVAPERFRSQRFVEATKQTQIQLLAVDEAHCISEWGHDFRHDYARLGRFRRRMGNPQTIALTATATPDVRQDVIAQLGMAEPEVFIAGFARPNLQFSVRHASSRAEKDEALIQLLNETPGSGIIYSSTRKGCEQVADMLRHHVSRRVGIYHAGLLPDERRAAQENFMSGSTPIVVATNAFGMGIDKADVRFVAHYNMTGTIEAYYQEAGRAGRDGKPARCCLLYSPRDRQIQEFFIENAYPSPRVVEQVYEYLCARPEDPIEITQQQLQTELDLEIGAEGIGTCERLLEKSGAIQRFEPHRNMAVIRIDSDLPTLVDLLPKQATARRKVMRVAEQIVKDIRREEVYVRPADIAAQAELPMTTVARTLRELSQLDIFDYVPPFRGRAIHVANPALRFADLEIDFDGLSKRKEADYEKLRSVISFACSEKCRQLEILMYFVDPDATECGSCDNCQTRPTRIVARIDSNDDKVIQTVRIALSGVARAQQRFGKQVIAAMLGGSRSAKITKWHLHELSTFGLLKHWPQTEISRLLDSLVAAGLLVQNEVDRFRPVLKLTDKGEQVMRGSAALSSSFALPTRILQRIDTNHKPLPQSHTAAAASVLVSANTSQHAAETATVVSSPPTALAEYAGATTSVQLSQQRSQQAARAQPNSETELDEPDHYWTWRLADVGFSLPQIERARRLPMAEIVNHLLQSLKEGRQLDIQRVFPASLREQFDQEQVTPESDAGIAAQCLQLYRKCLAADCPPF